MRFARRHKYDFGPQSFKILPYKQIKNSHITNLRTDQSKIITDKDQIVEEFARSYENLYGPEASEDKRAVWAYLRKLEYTQSSTRK